MGIEWRVEGERGVGRGSWRVWGGGLGGQGVFVLEQNRIACVAYAKVRRRLEWVTCLRQGLMPSGSHIGLVSHVPITSEVVCMLG